VSGPEPPEPEAPPELAGMRRGFGRTLRAGVVVSGLLLLAGLLLAAAQGSAGIAGRFGRVPLGNLASDLAAGQPWTFLWLGVAVLAVTPVLRVAIALVGFARTGDLPYVALTGFVLAVLLGSLVIGVVAG
jgi:uncharacterized membrane protein